LAEIIILDTDIASAFAKVHKIIPLKELFSRYDLVICPAIYEELIVSQEYGYSFPGQIFKNIKILSPTNDEISDYHHLQNTKKTLGKGELEALCICRRRHGIFSSMDTAALKFAGACDVQTLSIHAILRSFWISGSMTHDEVKELIDEIEKIENTTISDTELILSPTRIP
jgi:predicted nucleic acid-binding protein